MCCYWRNYKAIA
nr:unnamed protein product [Callosobruchus analis]